MNVVDKSSDDTGNMVRDRYKGSEPLGSVTVVEYNYLKLISKITVKASASTNKGTVEYQ